MTMPSPSKRQKTIERSLDARLGGVASRPPLVEFYARRPFAIRLRRLNAARLVDHLGDPRVLVFCNCWSVNCVGVESDRRVVAE
jgi:hypothetical protein